MNRTLSVDDYALILRLRLPTSHLLGSAHVAAIDDIHMLWATAHNAALTAAQGSYTTKPLTPNQTAELKIALYEAARKAAVVWEPRLALMPDSPATLRSLQALAHALRDVLRIVDKFDVLKPGPAKDALIVALGGKAEG